MAKPVDLGIIRFKNQSKAGEFFREILYRYMPGDRVNDEDSAILAELLKRHLDYSSKVGVGIDHFEVMRADFNSQCFGVVRIDGTEDNFSYKHCIDQRPRD